MDKTNSPFSLTVTVRQADATGIAEQRIIYNNLDDAMKAYGHSVQAVNELQRDQRKERAALRRAAGLHDAP
jgi:hypothetical protein